MDVGDVMRTDVVTCSTGDSVREAARALSDADVGCLPVLAADSRDRVVGMLTADDVCAAAAAERDLDRVCAEEVMRTPVRTCWRDDTLEAALAIMCGFGVRRLPVVEPGGGLVGLVSLSDVARGELAADRGLGRGLRDEITGALAMLCPARTPVPRSEAEVSEHREIG